MGNKFINAFYFRRPFGKDEEIIEALSYFSDEDVNDLDDPDDAEEEDHWD